MCELKNDLDFPTTCVLRVRNGELGNDSHMYEVGFEITDDRAEKALLCKNTKT